MELWVSKVMLLVEIARSNQTLTHNEADRQKTIGELGTTIGLTASMETALGSKANALRWFVHVLKTEIKSYENGFAF